MGEILNRYPRDTWHLVDKSRDLCLRRKRTDGWPFTASPEGPTALSPRRIFSRSRVSKCQVDYFDIYFLHNVNDTSVDFYADDAGAWWTICLNRRGWDAIKHVGFSAHESPETIDRFLTKYEGIFDEVQIQIKPGLDPAGCEEQV